MPGPKETRREIRADRRAREKNLRKVRTKVERQLVADGVLGRVEALKIGVRRPEVRKAIAAAILEHEGSKGAIKDYNVLRTIVETTLSLQGLEVRDVMLKFSWNGKDLGIDVHPSIPSVMTAAQTLKMDPEEAFRGLLAH